MATLKFYVPYENNPSSIYLRFKGGRKFDIKTTLPLQVNPEHWNQDKQEVRNVVSASE